MGRVVAGRVDWNVTVRTDASPDPDGAFGYGEQTVAEHATAPEGPNAEVSA